jgi:hypothetical protein
MMLDSEEFVVFTQPIVFIVGAGASAEYGMPLGAELKTKIASAVGYFSLAPDGRWGDPDLYKILNSKFGGEVSRHESAGRGLAKFLEAAPSIDEALHWFASREEVVELGKVAIVREILKAERASRLYNENYPRMIPASDFANTWIPELLSMVMPGHQNEHAEQAFDKVTIINFNYDRTVEHFIYTTLQRRYSLEEARVKKIISNIHMLRPYGTIGALDWQSEPALAFGADFDNVDFFSLSKNILTYSEQGVADEVKSRIQTALEAARVSFFLGFGFHSQNMNLLRIRRGGEEHRRAFATVFGMHGNNAREMQIAIANVVGCSLANPPMLLDLEAFRLLSHMRPSLMATAGL